MNHLRSRPQHAKAFALHSVIAAAAVLGFAHAATGAEILACPTDLDVPQAVAAKLDSTLAMIVDGKAETAAGLGYAPGAELFVRAPGWTYHRSVGTADFATQEPLDCGRPFQIGSNTKMMTATVLMQLVEEGALALDDPLSAHLPEVAAALPFGDKITLRQLANHTSGVFSYTDNAPNGAPGILEGAITNKDLLALAYTPEEMVRFAVDNGAPNFEPGADGQWSYSNTGFILIGMILEKTTGKPLADQFRDRIFTPLGMQNTFLWNDVPKPEFNLPHSYYQPPFDIDMSDWNMSQAWAAGAVISTSADMDLFVRGVLNGDLFKTPETLSSMMEGVPTAGGFRQYGIGIGEKVGGFWGHGGQTLGFESDIGLYRDQDISLVVWTNSGRNLAALGATVVFGALGDVDALAAPAEAGSSLAGTGWAWVSTKGGSGTAFTVDDPSRYTVLFQQAGDLAVQADCNRVLGSYKGTGDALSLTLTASTKALCPEGSQEDRFVQELSQTATARVEGDRLFLVLTSDGKTMEFQRHAD